MVKNQCTFLVIVFILFITSCTPVQEKQNIIEIGSIQALTGVAAKYGLNVQSGIYLAVHEINKEGGINGKLLKVIHEDGQCDQKFGINGAKKLIVDKVPVIIGPTCSSVAMAIAPILEERKIIMLTPVSSVPALKYAGDYIFRNRVSGEAHGIKMAEFAIEELRAKTASVLFINLDNGFGFSESFTKKFTELGGKILNAEPYEKGTTDFRSQLFKIKEKNPDVIFLAGQGHEIAIKQTREMGINIQIIGPITIETLELFEVAGDAAEGIYYSYASFDSDSNDSIVFEFQKRYKEMYGRKSEAYAANAYDAVMLIAQAIKKCDKNTDCIRDYLYSVKDYHGVSGMTTFDAYGEVTKPLIIKKIINGEFVIHGK